MKRLVGLTGMGILLAVLAISAGEPALKGSASPETVVSVSIIYDNYQVDEHGDHTAGIPWITETNPSVNCYLPSAFAAQLKDKGKLPLNSKAIEKPTHIYGPFYSTGDSFEAFREQGLVIKTEKGGVHLMSKSRKQMEMIAASLKELGVKQICPTHCTGKSSPSTKPFTLLLFNYLTT